MSALVSFYGFSIKGLFEIGKPSVLFVLNVFKSVSTSTYTHRHTHLYIHHQINTHRQNGKESKKSTEKLSDSFIGNECLDFIMPPHLLFAIHGNNYYMFYFHLVFAHVVWWWDSRWFNCYVESIKCFWYVAPFSVCISTLIYV